MPVEIIISKHLLIMFTTLQRNSNTYVRLPGTETHTCTVVVKVSRAQVPRKDLRQTALNLPDMVS